MQSSPHLLRATTQALRDAVVTTDGEARVRMLNPAAEALTGWQSPEACGLPIEEIVDLRDNSGDSQLLNPVYAALRDGHPVDLPRYRSGQETGHALLIGNNGHRFAVQATATPVAGDNGKPEACVLVLHDLGETVRLAERMAYHAQLDPLTGLPNRILLVDRMEQAARLADRHNQRLAVFFVDLDRFSAIKNTWGPAFADELLIEAAFRLSAVLRESDTVCRLGRDEFVVLLSEIRSLAQIEAVAAKLLEEMAQPFHLGARTVSLSCSVGVSVYPQDASDTGTLMRLADKAMVQAKQTGRNRYVFANPEIWAQSQLQAQFQPQLQPQFQAQLQAQLQAMPEHMPTGKLARE